MYSIGEFSKITGLTVKTLRFYHEKGLLIPALVDDQSGYRYYDFPQIDKARVIGQLRSLEFTLEHIGEILTACEDEADILVFLQRQRQMLSEKIQRQRGVIGSLDKIIQHEREARMAVTNSTFEVEEKVLEPVLIAGVRMKGRYSDCGKGFSKIGRAFGRHISGKCMLLHYDTEYKEDDAEFEACMPIRKGHAMDGIDMRQLPGGRCVCLLHKGPYPELSRSYAKVMAYAKEHGLEIVTPTREVYLKGPGIIFKGNPKNYLTEIQLPVTAQASAPGRGTKP